MLTAAPIAPTTPAAWTRARPFSLSSSPARTAPRRSGDKLQPRDAAGRRVADREGRDLEQGGDPGRVRARSSSGPACLPARRQEVRPRETAAASSQGQTAGRATRMNVPEMVARPAVDVDRDHEAPDRPEPADRRRVEAVLVPGHRARPPLRWSHQPCFEAEPACRWSPSASRRWPDPALVDADLRLPSSPLTSRVVPGSTRTWKSRSPSRIRHVDARQGPRRLAQREPVVERDDCAVRPWAAAVAGSASAASATGMTTTEPETALQMDSFRAGVAGFPRTGTRQAEPGPRSCRPARRAATGRPPAAVRG